LNVHDTGGGAIPIDRASFPRYGERRCVSQGITLGVGGISARKTNDPIAPERQLKIRSLWQ
jgi:hypothetical protein